MSLSQIRDRMEREFATLRADLKRMEGALSAVQRDIVTSRDARQRVKRASALLRDAEWQPAHGARAKTAQRTCPVCGGAQPNHGAGCNLAAALAVLEALDT